MTGLLLLDKPPGMTSFSAVSRARRVLGVKKAGHTGTLDPMATGVLPVLLGGATRFAEFLPSRDKAYLAGFTLGITTDTLDITGNILLEKNINVSRETIQAALTHFRGNIMQTPPMVSALKKDGVRLYDLARRGIEVEREPRPVEIFALELVGDSQLYVECSAGTYIRTLIDDLGAALGCGACMSSLRRVKANGCGIEQCVTLEQLERGEFAVIPIDEALDAYPAVQVSPAQAVRFRNGGALDLDRTGHSEATKKPAEGELRRVYGDIFLGLGRVQGDVLAIARLLV